MIVVKFIGGLSCPFFACDECGEVIEDPGRAMCCWGEPDICSRPENATIEVKHAHKGACELHFERTLPEGYCLMDEELTDHLEFLRNNTLRPAIKMKR